MNQSETPSAILIPRRRLSWMWLLPVAAAIFAIVLLYQSWAMRGIAITIQLEDGHGLKTADDVRYRGISVGVVDSVSLLPNSQTVLVRARLHRDSDLLARAGSQFWVVRPRLRLTSIEGLETIIGPRYLAVQPATIGDALPPRQRSFVGLAQPPIVESIQPGDLEIILQAAQRGSMHPGAPVTYRQTRIGSILSVGINSDASAVEARLHIQQPFVQLIRPNTRFWDVGGIEAKLGLTGLTVQVHSAEALLVGGIALATPSPSDSGGDVVRNGHRFLIASKPESDWLEWQPVVAIGSSLLPAGIAPPSPLRAVIGWKQGRWIKGQRSNHGWVLQTNEGLLGPADLLKAGPKADVETVVLEVAGLMVSLNTPSAWERNGLAMLKADASLRQWHMSSTRSPQQPEDCLIIADPADHPMPIAAARLVPGDAGWSIDPAVSIPPTWHGASVVSRADGMLLGLLLLEDGVARVAFAQNQAMTGK